MSGTILCKYEDYKAEKGELHSVEEAFAQGQKVAFAYMGDCVGSLVFDGYEWLIRKIENSRPKKCDFCKKEYDTIIRADNGNICMDCYHNLHKTEELK